MSTPHIRIRQLAFAHGRKKVLSGVDLDLYPGKIYGLVGSNGSGKSTLLRLLAGALRSSAGEIAVRGTVGYVAQKFSLYEDLRVEENIRFFARCHGLSGLTLEERVSSLLSRFGLESIRRQRTSDQSQGWKQRIAMAAALCHNPSTLLLDEVTSGLDPRARQDLWTYLAECRQAGMSILLSTHFLEEAQRCDEIWSLEEGCLQPATAWIETAA
jgi:ABC-2 type transport system ATP-binding protein